MELVKICDVTPLESRSFEFSLIFLLGLFLVLRHLQMDLPHAIRNNGFWLSLRSPHVCHTFSICFEVFLRIKPEIGIPHCKMYLVQR